MDSNPFVSRKFILTAVGILIMSSIPILYKQLGISDSITLVVVGAIAGATGVYAGFNTLAKKYEGPNDQPGV